MMLSFQIDIDLAISTSEDNRATASELSFILQTIGPSEDPNIRKMIIADICDLYKKPELAKNIREYQPEPDPLNQRLQQLQIEMLEAQIANERAKGGRAEIDSKLKEAKTQVELAKAENISSNTDSNDLDYLQKFYGVNEKAKQNDVLLSVDNNTEEKIQMVEALERLEKNRDFQKVILEGYMKDEVLRANSLLANHTIKAQGKRPDIIEINIVSKIFCENRTVERTNDLNIKGSCFL